LCHDPSQDAPPILIPGPALDAVPAPAPEPPTVSAQGQPSPPAHLDADSPPRASRNLEKAPILRFSIYRPSPTPISPNLSLSYSYKHLDISSRWSWSTRTGNHFRAGHAPSWQTFQHVSEHKRTRRQQQTKVEGRRFIHELHPISLSYHCPDNDGDGSLPQQPSGIFPYSPHET